MTTIRELMAVIALLSLFFAVDMAFGPTSHRLSRSAITLGLVGLFAITSIVKLLLKRATLAAGIRVNLIAASIATALFLTYHEARQTHYRPEQFDVVRFLTVAAYQSPLLFVASWTIAWVFDRGYDVNQNQCQKAESQ